MPWDVSRRVFLRGAGLAAAGVGLGPSPLMLRAAEAARAGKEVLVHIFFRGGFDGLNFLTPYDDSSYQQARPGIALRKNDPDAARRALPLDGYFGLHNGLAPLEALYRDGRLGFVPAVGHLGLSRSHFDAQDYIEHATPGDKTTKDGWLGRALPQVPGDSVTDQVAFSAQLPRSFGVGTEPVLVTQGLARFEVRAGAGTNVWSAPAEEALRKMYRGDGEGVRVGREMFAAIDALSRRPPAAGGSGVTYPASTIGNSLREAAQVIKADLGTRTIFVNVAGAFDTHANQLPANTLEFGRIGQSLAAFAMDLGPRLDDVVVLGLTEFGRTFNQNGSMGTDHGAGSCAFYMGGRVRGGRILGRWPGLSKSELNEQRELMPTTDFRDLFAEVLQKQLGIADLARVLPGHTPRPVGML
jgi:uncharacterized protein (DUF1501 family)